LLLTSPNGKTTTNILLENDEKLVADIVVINADLVYAYNNLISSLSSSSTTTKATQSTSYIKSLQTRASSRSSISF